MNILILWIHSQSSSIIYFLQTSISPVFQYYCSNLWTAQPSHCPIYVCALELISVWTESVINLQLGAVI